MSTIIINIHAAQSILFVIWETNKINKEEVCKYVYLVKKVEAAVEPEPKNE
jgi:hypothetical protein